MPLMLCRETCPFFCTEHFSISKQFLHIYCGLDYFLCLLLPNLSNRLYNMDQVQSQQSTGDQKRAHCAGLRHHDILFNRLVSEMKVFF